MRYTIVAIALIFTNVLGAKDINISTNHVEVARKLLLTGARVNSEFTQVQWLKARFIEVGGSTNTIIVDFHGSSDPNVRTLTTVITACVDWTTPKERDEWHEVQAEAVFNAAFLTKTNSLGDLYTIPDISKWSLISLKIENSKTK
jgi:hypothetical protein